LLLKRNIQGFNVSNDQLTAPENNSEKSTTNEQPSADEKSQLVQKLSKLTTGAAVAAVLVDASTNPTFAE
jgi:hypothetical protein